MHYLTVGKENSHDITLYYKDWGKGQPIVFSHGWPLSADAWDAQLFFFASQGYRCIAHDRRGFGRSSQSWSGNDMDSYADDLLHLVEALDLQDVIHVGHSMGGGEVARYLGRHGTKRVAKAVLIGAVPPLMIKTPHHPEGLPAAVFDEMRTNILADRAQFFKEVAIPFYSAEEPGAHVSQGLLDSFWQQGMQASIKGVYDCVKQFSETDFTEDLKKIDVPTLFIHGDNDLVVPMEISSIPAAKLVKDAQLKIYKGAPHGVCSTHKEAINKDILDFIKK